MTAPNFAPCLQFTLAHEGGFVDDPADRGGATNMGITQETLSNWLGRAVSMQEVQQLPRVIAAQIYAHEYWAPVAGDKLPAGLDLMVFDFGVNAGPGTSARRLQGLFQGLRQDGAIGPVTLKAVAAHDLAWIISALDYSQQAYYNALVTEDATQERFLAGWLARCSDRAKAARAMMAPAAANG